MTVETLADAIVAACGSAGNIEHAEQCFTRLRVVVRDLDVVEFSALEGLAEVRMAFEQAGEVHLLLDAPLSETVAAVNARLG